MFGEHRVIISTRFVDLVTCFYTNFKNLERLYPLSDMCKDYNLLLILRQP